MTSEPAHEAGADVKPETGAAHLLPLPVVELGEALEDAQVVGRVDAWPLVLHHEPHPLADPPDPNALRRAAAVLEGVVGQVQQDAVQVVGVGGDKRRVAAFEHERELALGPGHLEL